MTSFSRRRFLTISAACTLLPSGASATPVARWRGAALGAEASLRLEGMGQTQAAPVIAAVEAEVRRLENIFSLYRPNSDLSRLNRDGVLPNPAPELLDVLSLSGALNDATKGAFDPTIQPLWMAIATNAASAAIVRAQAAVGWKKVNIGADQIRLSEPGVSGITLNGIAQGAITDRVASLLKERGLRDVLVDLGEIAAIGQRGDGSEWRVGLTTSDGGIQQRITLRDRAVATSAPTGTMLNAKQGHILNPTGGSHENLAVSVSAPSAAVADGLSTALCLIEPERMAPVLARFPQTKLEMLI
ncbi:MAG: FAD:protein FMN transferase [Ruegeria sp.]